MSVNEIDVNAVNERTQAAEPMKLVFLDVETTGLEDEDRLCQVAYITNDGRSEESLFRPPLPIKVGAMAISHITNHHVEKSMPFLGSTLKSKLLRLASEGYTLVAHNAKFDVKMLEKEGVVFPTTICTMKLARSIDSDEKMENYRLQYLRYFYDVQLDDASAHDAMGDTRVLEAVFNHIVGNHTLEEMIDITSKPMLYQTMPFGKYKGGKIREIVGSDQGYLEWLLGEKMKDEENETDWIYTLNYWLGRLPV